MKRIPVTILTGFLGAGKTTLLNHLIESQPNTKFAIIENEFGAINIDKDLVNTQAQGIFELSNGCICCSLNQELGQTLNKLVTTGKDFDHLIIETTGVAEPDGILSVFINDYHFDELFEVNAVIGMIDAEHLLKSLESEPVAKRQLALADLLVFNKSSEIDEEIKQNVLEAVKAINPLASIIHTDYAKVNAEEVLSQFSFRADTVNERILNSKSEKGDHHKGIKSLTFSQNKPLNLNKFQYWLRSLLLFNPDGIYRIKGLLNKPNTEEKVIIQSVRGNIIFSEGDKWSEDDDRTSQLVIIGHGLDRETLQKGIDSCAIEE
ncbi:CobW family GTP-binding protein [Sediminitomix flava]|uniref:G3E family GTPase n=1 Tax=Sediminitomix flava TaxID=379075 RepID=A0A315Z935_SEDFL|nr:GTP-binding protein [Sediminitomix flava]PWJ40220.1 G3E family GTPase [Sediminitomix flava]